MSDLTAYQIRVLVELASYAHDAWLSPGCQEEPTAPQLAARVPGWDVADLRNMLRDLRGRGLVMGRWQRWRLTDAGRRAAVLAQSDEVLR